MEAKHTPGPWSVGDAGDWRAEHEYSSAYSSMAITEAKGSVVALAVQQDFEGDDDLAANALLIAAAPDLLEVLKDLLSGVLLTQKPEIYPVTHPINRAIAAIAKADGAQ